MPFLPSAAFGIQGLFGTGKTYCASAALILLTRMLGLKALFVAEPNLPLQEFSRNVQSLLADAPEEVSCQFPRLRPALNSSKTMNPAVLPLLSAPFSTKLDGVAAWPGYPSYVCG